MDAQFQFKENAHFSLNFTRVTNLQISLDVLSIFLKAPSIDFNLIENIKNPIL